jgi:hypothetical protein
MVEYYRLSTGFSIAKDLVTPWNLLLSMEVQFQTNVDRFRWSNATISSGDPILPENITTPFMTRAGVAITPYLIIFLMSLTITTRPFLPLSRKASSVLQKSALQIAPPVPRTSIFIRCSFRKFSTSMQSSLSLPLVLTSFSTD